MNNKKGEMVIDCVAMFFMILVLWFGLNYRLKQDREAGYRQTSDFEDVGQETESK